MDRTLKCVGICSLIALIASADVCDARGRRPCRPVRVRCCPSSAVACCGTVLAAQPGSIAPQDAVTLEKHPDNVVVKIGGQEFTVLHYGDSVRKPYFLPVKGKDGAILTRPIDPNEKEHPHHKGFWLSVDEVNEIKFWVEREKIVTRNLIATSGNPATIQLRNEWIDASGTPVLLENTTISIYADRLITYDITLSRPAGKTVVFGDTKEGFFGIRIAQSMREKEGGSVFNSEGQKTTQACWGQTAKWVDYTGQVDGKTYGVTIMDHPNNFRPSRYHVRDYGLFSVNPFGEGAYQNDKDKAKPVTLDDTLPSLRIRYALYVHDGASSATDLTKVYQQFVETTK
jgi:hypothetical protein